MKKLKKLIRAFGPGFITGAADDDPSGIATYAQTGALFGFSQSWTSVFSFPFMAAVQEMCGRIGLVTGQGLAGIIKIHYPKKILYISVILLFIANTINIGADLGAMAASLQLVFGLPFFFWLTGIVFVTLALEIFVSYKRYAQYLKYLTFALFAYILTALVIKLDWGTILISTFIPHLELSKAYLFNIVAIFGTTISPYLFFWQASEEVEEEVAHRKLYQMGAGVPKITPKDISRLRTDTIIGMFFSNIVMFFIIVTTGATLYTHGIRTIESAYDAALALKPLAGDLAFLLFALGIIGTGFLAVPILAGSASYAVSEVFGWREGLSRKLKVAPGFYGVIIFATIVGALINFIGINPILFLYYSAVINGLIAPPLIFMVLAISNNETIMKGNVNGRFANILGYSIAIFMGLSSILLLLSLLKVFG